MINLALVPLWPALHTQSGTTAVVALYREDRLWVANAGDSRAVLGTEAREALAKGSSSEAKPTMVICLNFLPICSDFGEKMLLLLDAFLRCFQYLKIGLCCCETRCRLLAYVAAVSLSFRLVSCTAHTLSLFRTFGARRIFLAEAAGETTGAAFIDT